MSAAKKTPPTPPKKQKRRYRRRLKSKLARTSFVVLRIEVNFDRTATMGNVADMRDLVAKQAGVRGAFFVGSPLIVGVGPRFDPDTAPF